MKQAVAAAILLSIAALSVFGYLGMHPGGLKHIAGCIASAIAGATCPPGTPFEQAAFHLNAFAGLSRAVLSAPVLAALVFFIVAFLMWSAEAGGGLMARFKNVFVEREARRAAPLGERRITLWLRLKENSPAGF